MSNQPSGEIAPKPFEFVPFPRQVARREIAGHERLDLANRYSGRLTLIFETLTPLFIGTGSYALGKDCGFPKEKVVRPFYRVNGAPTIPGSSLKGVARSIAEAVSPSCITTTRILPDQLPQGMELVQSRNNKCLVNYACPACSLFGHSGQSHDVRANYLGKVSFGDAQLIGSGRTQLFRLAPLFAPRPGKPRGRKFYYHSVPAEDTRQPPVEVVPDKQRFQCRIDLENLSQAELGLLCFALGIGGTLTLKLGGGKPLGLGSLAVVKAELALLAEDHFVQADSHEMLYAGKELADLLSQLIDAAIRDKILLREQALAVSDRILHYSTARRAPDGAY